MRCVLLGAVLGAACGCGKPTPDTNAVPKADKPVAVAPGTRASSPIAVFPPADWTHKELAEHLRLKGMSLTVRLIPQYSGDGKVAAGFFDGNGEPSDLAVLVYHCPDSQGARIQAGAMGANGHAFGHFAIGLYPRGREGINDADLLQRIRVALTPPN